MSLTHVHSLTVGGFKASTGRDWEEGSWHLLWGERWSITLFLHMSHCVRTKRGVVSPRLLYFFLSCHVSYIPSWKGHWITVTLTCFPRSLKNLQMNCLAGIKTSENKSPSILNEQKTRQNQDSPDTCSNLISSDRWRMSQKSQRYLRMNVDSLSCLLFCTHVMLVTISNIWHGRHI